MTRTPARGLLLIKKPTLQDTVGGIVLLEKTRHGWAQGQAEIVAVGPPAYAEEDDEDQVEGLVPIDPRLVPGAWVLCKHRTWLPTDRDDEFVIKQSDVLAVLGVERVADPDPRRQSSGLSDPARIPRKRAHHR